jgi:hypothetical protein
VEEYPGTAPTANPFYDKEGSRAQSDPGHEGALAQMARACYYAMRDQVSFDPALFIQSL